MWKFMLQPLWSYYTTTDKTDNSEFSTVPGKIGTAITSILLLRKLRIREGKLCKPEVYSCEASLLFQGFLLVHLKLWTTLLSWITVMLSSVFQLPSPGTPLPHFRFIKPRWCRVVMVTPWGCCLKYSVSGHHAGIVVLVSFREAGAGSVVSKSWPNPHSYGEYGGVFSLKFTYSVCLKIICIIDQTGKIY